MPISSNRAPPPPELPLDSCPPPPESPTYIVPTKRILSKEDHALFLESPTHRLVLNFVTDLNTSVLNRPNSYNCPVSSFLQNILSVLDNVEAVFKACPPEEQGLSRFGNKGFQKFYDQIWEKSPGWHTEILGLNEEQSKEIGRYFCEAWGNRTRIDYGSGHELNFLCWMCVSVENCLNYKADGV